MMLGIMEWETSFNCVPSASACAEEGPSSSSTGVVWWRGALSCWAFLAFSQSGTCLTTRSSCRAIAKARLVLSSVGIDSYGA
eukprot:3430224-Amphidinium_carterae.1